MGKPRKFWLNNSRDGLPDVYKHKKEIKHGGFTGWISDYQVPIVLGRPLGEDETVAVRLVPRKKGDKVKGVYLCRVSGDYAVFRTRKDAREGGGILDASIRCFCGTDFEAVTGVKLEQGEIVRVRLEEV